VVSDFLVQTNTDTPIYRQLIDQVRRMAVSGRLKSGERLPSVRQLADELAVNPMTISKAYSLLENEGLLERRRGVGMVLRGDDRSAEELIEPALTDLIRQARQLGLSRNKILNSLKDRWEETDNE